VERPEAILSAIPVPAPHAFDPLPPRRSVAVDQAAVVGIVDPLDKAVPLEMVDQPVMFRGVTSS